MGMVTSSEKDNIPGDGNIISIEISSWVDVDYYELMNTSATIWTGMGS